MHDPIELRGQYAIAGIGMTDISKDSRRTEMMLACQAIEKAVEDAGIERHEVDGMLTWDWEKNTLWDVAKNCGFKKVRYFGQTAHGGGAGCGAVAHAVQAIATGMAKCVVIWRAINGRSGARMADGMGLAAAAGEYQFKFPFGLLIPPSMMAIRTRRYMHTYGITTEQLGAVAVACRKHAQTNPNALMYGKPITLADYAHWTEAQLLPYFETALRAFGPARLMFGSDWPPCLVAGGYARWLSLVHRWTITLSHAEQARLFGGTAIEAYRLETTHSG